MIALLLPFLVLAGLGLASSLIAHLLAVAGVAPPGGSAVMLLHWGIFLIWIPVVWVSWQFKGQRSRRDWKQMLSGCPDWMRYGVYGLVAYAVLNFLLMMGKQVLGKDISADTVRMFSGHWMAFYAAGFAALYSVYRQPWMLSAAKCPNGHEVMPTDNFCPTCGKSIPPRRSATVSS